MLEDRLHLGVNFVVLGWIYMILFDGGGVFLPKRTTGAISDNWKTDPSSFLVLGHPPAAERVNRIRKIQ
jgi:hypothetical protein